MTKPIVTLEKEMKAAEFDLWMSVKASGRPFSAKNANEVIRKLYWYIAEQTARRTPAAAVEQPEAVQS